MKEIIKPMLRLAFIQMDLLIDKVECIDHIDIGKTL